MRKSISFSFSLLITFCFTGVVGCGSDEDACSTDETQKCFCSDGTELTQTCSADSIWSVCPCSDDPSDSEFNDTDETEYGEWCDPATSLCWQHPERYRAKERGFHWQNAMDYCQHFELSGDMDWRLPTIDELRTLVRGCPFTETGGGCPVKDGSTIDDFRVEAGGVTPCMDDCFTETPDGPGIDGCFWPDELGDSCKRVQSSSPKEYWSSSKVVGGEEALGDVNIWYIFFGEGGAVGYNFEESYSFMRCVRDGS